MLSQWVSTECVRTDARFVRIISGVALWSPLYLYILATGFWLRLREDRKEKLAVSRGTPCCQRLDKGGPELLGQLPALQAWVQNFTTGSEPCPWGDAPGNQNTVFQNCQVAEGSIYKHAYSYVSVNNMILLSVQIINMVLSLESSWYIFLLRSQLMDR